MLEAHGRKFWHPDAETLAQLQALYEQAEAQLEGVRLG
jgi:magnesium chelatase subunit H